MQNKIRNRAQIVGSDSRSRSKENGSISKRNLKLRKNKSNDKSPINTNYKANKVGTNNVIVHQARNESVKRMFKNLNRTRAKLASIRKQVDISGSNQNIKQEKDGVNDSNNYQNKSYLAKSQQKNNRALKRDADELDRLLFEKSNKISNYMKAEGQIMVNETKAKKEPNTRIEMVNSSKSNKQSQNLTSKEVNNSKLVDYFENSRRISIDEEPSEVVPKIEISLNQCFNKKKSHQTKMGNMKEFNKNNQLKSPPEHKFSAEKEGTHYSGIGD
jgi:hypothetical protein